VAVTPPVQDQLSHIRILQGLKGKEEDTRCICIRTF